MLLYLSTEYFLSPGWVCLLVPPPFVCILKSKYTISYSINIIVGHNMQKFISSYYLVQHIYKLLLIYADNHLLEESILTPFQSYLISQNFSKLNLNSSSDVMRFQVKASPPSDIITAFKRLLYCFKRF